MVGVNGLHTSEGYSIGIENNASNGGGWCMVCGTIQSFLSLHMVRHSKDEIIRAISTGHPISQATPRRGPGRPRRISYNATVPITAPQTLIIPRAQPVDYLGQAPPAVHYDQGLVSPNVRLASVIHPQTGMVSVPPSHLQPQLSSTGNSVLLIGNGVLPCSNIVSPNNFQLPGNRLSYIIPTSNNLIMTTSPTNNQAVLLSPTANNTSVAIKQQDIPFTSPSVITSTPTLNPISTGSPHTTCTNTTTTQFPTHYAGILSISTGSPHATCTNTTTTTTTQFPTHYAGILAPKSSNRNTIVSPIKDNRPSGPKPFAVDLCSSNRTEGFIEEQIDSNPTINTTIQIGKNIKISLPKDIADKKDRLQEIINQELVRAILLNDQEFYVPEKPSTSTDAENLKLGSTASLSKLSNIPSNFSTEKIDNDDVLKNTNKRSSKNIKDEMNIIDSSVPINCNIGLVPSDQRRHADFMPSSSDNSLVIDTDGEDCYTAGGDGVTRHFKSQDELSDNEQSRGMDLSNALFSSISSTFDPDNHHASEVPPEYPVSKFDNVSVSTINQSFCKRNFGEYPDNVGNLEVTAEDGIKEFEISSEMSSQQAVDTTHVQEQPTPTDICNQDDQPLSFFSSDRNLNTLGLLGEPNLSQMVYVEEQVLGAVEVVFANGSNFIPTADPPNNLQIKSEPVNIDSRRKKGKLSKSSDLIVPSASHPNAMDYSLSTSNKSSYQACQTIASTSETPSTSSKINESITIQQINKKLEKITSDDEDMVDDPESDEDFRASIFPNEAMFDCELSGSSTQHDEVMSLKASETLADSDSERASPPHEDISDLMFYGRYCMFAGEPGPPHLSPRTFPQLDTSVFQRPMHLDQHNAQMNGNEVMVNGGGSNLLTIPPVSEHGGYITGSNTTDNNLPAATLNMNLDSSSCSILTLHEGHTLLSASMGADTLASAATTAATSTVSSDKHTITDQFQWDQKEDTKICLSNGVIDPISRQLSPIPSTSGLQANHNLSSANLVKKAPCDDEIYDLEYESDAYGDSDSDGSVNRTSIDADHSRCVVCNKLFKNLKEKLLHAGQHSPCATVLDGSDKSSHNPIKGEKVKDDSGISLMQCKEEALMDDTKLIPSCENDGIYKCLECKIEFPTSEELFTHRKTLFTSRLSCHICHIFFSKRIHKIRHMKTHPVSDLKCLICNRNFPTNYSWSQHQLYHLGFMNFYCKVCGRGFQNKHELAIHTRSHTGERPFGCRMCNKWFFRSQALKRHLFTHMDGQEIDCDVCQRSFKNVIYLQKHMISAHPKGKTKPNKVIRDYMCFVCNQIFPSQKKLSWHQEVHERWPKKCNQCGDCFVHQSNLTKHIRFIHDSQYVTNDGKSENNTKCNICHKMFKKSSIVQHLRTHTGDKPYKCNLCHKQFSVKCNLTSHKWVHMGVRDRPFKCKLCDRSFLRTKALEAHIRSHKNIRPFTCNECGKSFIHKNNLRLHVSEHSGKKNHVCEHCGKSFFRKYNLNNHVRVHTGETPYKCTICGKNFAQKSNYNVHMKAFHVVRQSRHEEV